MCVCDFVGNHLNSLLIVCINRLGQQKHLHLHFNFHLQHKQLSNEMETQKQNFDIFESIGRSSRLS